MTQDNANSKPLTYTLQGPQKVEFSFSPTGGPIDDDSPAVKELFEKLGRASAAWARMEFMLDAILLHVNKASTSAELYDDRHAFGFKNKVDLMKRWLDHPDLADEKELNRKVLTNLKLLANSRNEIFHSHLKSYDANAKEFELQYCQFQGNDTFKIGSGKLKLEALDALIELANASTLALTEIANKLFKRTD